MKAFLLATAMIAAPVFAQSSTMTQPPAETTTTETTTTDTTTTTSTDTTPESAPTAPGQPAPGPDAAATTNTMAGDQAMQAQTPAPAGAGPVVFQQPQSVEQAFPAPAPKANYPWCTRTVTDGCKQRVDPK